MRKKRFFPVLLILSILIGALAIFQSGLFTVRGVEVTDTSCASQEQIKSTVKLEGKSIFMVPVDLSNKVGEYLCIKSLLAKRSYPSKVKLTVVEREGLVRLQSYTKQIELDLNEASVSSQTALIDFSFPVSSQSSYLVADKDGLIFTESQSYDLPILLVLDQNLMTGQVIDNKNFYKIETISFKLRELVGFSVLKLDNGTLLVDTEPGIAFNIERDELIQLGSLQLLLQKAKIDGREIKSIDLRFNKPIVVYGKGK